MHIATRRILLLGLACAALAGCGGGGGSADSSSSQVSTPSPEPPPSPESIVQVDQTWTCREHIDLDLVRITMTAASARGPRRHADAVHLRPGCTGRIGR